MVRRWIGIKKQTGLLYIYIICIWFALMQSVNVGMHLSHKKIEIRKPVENVPIRPDKTEAEVQAPAKVVNYSNVTFHSITESKQNKTIGKPKSKPNVFQNWEVLTRDSIKIHNGEIFPSNAVVPVTVHTPYIISNKHYCSGFLILNYVVVVHTAVQNFRNRQSMRKTWARETVVPGMYSRIVFVLGEPRNRSLQSAIYQESKRFGDIVQGAFIDDYKNLTLKAVLALRWVTENCRHAEYLIKVDDDVFVNIPLVIKYIFPILANNSKQIVCSAQSEGPIVRPKSGKLNAKWMVREDYFRHTSMYPMPFCYGFATFYSVSLAMELFERAKYTPFFHLDDVFVYGILASKVKGISWRNTGKSFYKLASLTRRAMDKENINVPFLVGTVRGDALMQKLWAFTQKNIKEGTPLKRYMDFMHVYNRTLKTSNLHILETPRQSM